MRRIATAGTITLALTLAACAAGYASTSDVRDHTEPLHDSNRDRLGSAGNNSGWQQAISPQFGPSTGTYGYNRRAER